MTQVRWVLARGTSGMIEPSMTWSATDAAEIAVAVVELQPKPRGERDGRQKPAAGGIPAAGLDARRTLSSCFARYLSAIGSGPSIWPVSPLTIEIW